MHRSLARSRALSLFVFAIACLISSGANAAPDPRVEKEAKELRSKAIEEDSLGLQYGAAIEKLQQAITKCGAEKCSANLRAQLHMDVGAMQFNNKEKDKALASFVDAARIEPTLVLSKDYRTAEMDELWDQAKRRSVGGTPSDSGPGPSSADWEHTAPKEQQANTPLPIYVKYVGKDKVVKVLVRYKGSQMGSLESAELTKMGDGWGGIIPCKDVTQGTLQYYVRGENEGGDQIKLGDPDHAFKVAIKNDKVDDPPSLPGASPPKQCTCPPDAPPDFPGCQKSGSSSSEPEKKDEGADCEDDNECKSGTCTKHACGSGGPATKSKFSRVWIGVTGSWDFDILPTGDDVCKLQVPQATPLNSAG